MARQDEIDDSSQFRDVLYALSPHFSRIDVICRSGRRAAQPWSEGNLHLFPLASRPRALLLWRILARGCRLLRQQHADVVVSQDVLLMGLAAYLLHCLTRVPLVVELHGDYLDNPRWVRQSPIHRLANAWGKWLLHRAQLVRVTSKQIEAYALRAGLDEHRLFFLPHRTDISKFRPGLSTQHLRAELGLDNQAVLLFVGRLAPEKGLEMLLDGFAIARHSCPGLRLLIAGDGPSRPALEARVASEFADGTVRLLGKVPNSKLPEIYNLAEALLLTSIYEGRPKVVQEALACGTPVISTRVSGVSELIADGENGFIVDIGRSDQLAAAILKLTANHERRRDMRRLARRVMELDFTWERGIREQIKMYRLGAARLA